MFWTLILPVERKSYCPSFTKITRSQRMGKEVYGEISFTRQTVNFLPCDYVRILLPFPPIRPRHKKASMGRFMMALTLRIEDFHDCLYRQGADSSWRTCFRERGWGFGYWLFTSFGNQQIKKMLTCEPWIIITE